MNFMDLMTQIISETTGKPKDFVRTIVVSGAIIAGANMEECTKEIPDEEYQRKLAELQQNKAGIYKWLVDGARRAEEKLRRAKFRIEPLEI